MNKMEPERVLLQKVSIRLPPKVIEAIDTGVKNGLGHTRSEVIRKTIQATMNLAGPGREILTDFITQVLSEPLEYMFWLANRLKLFLSEDADQRLYAARMTSMIKSVARMTGTDEDQDYGQIEERILHAISNILAPEGFSTVIPDERLIQIPTSEGPLPPPADPPLREGFDVFIKRLTQRIEAGAAAEEVAAKITVLICLAGIQSYYGAKDVNIELWLMSEAFDLGRTLLHVDSHPDPIALADAFDTWVLTVPALYHKVDLREEVKVFILKGLGEAPSEESKTAQHVSEIQDEESQVPVNGDVSKSEVGRCIF